MLLLPRHLLGSDGVHAFPVSVRLLFLGKLVENVCLLVGGGEARHAQEEEERGEPTHDRTAWKWREERGGSG